MIDDSQITKAEKQITGYKFDVFICITIMSQIFSVESLQKSDKKSDIKSNN